LLANSIQLSFICAVLPQLENTKLSFPRPCYSFTSTLDEDISATGDDGEGGLLLHGFGWIQHFLAGCVFVFRLLRDVNLMALIKNQLSYLSLWQMCVLHSEYSSEAREIMLLFEANASARLFVCNWIIIASTVGYENITAYSIPCTHSTIDVRNWMQHCLPFCNQHHILGCPL